MDTRKIVDSMKLAAWIIVAIMIVNYLLGLLNINVIGLFVAGYTGITPTIGGSLISLLGGLGISGFTLPSILITYISALAIVLVGSFVYDFVKVPAVKTAWGKLTVVLLYGTTIFYLLFVGMKLLPAESIVGLVVYYALVAISLGIVQKSAGKIFSAI